MKQVTIIKEQDFIERDTYERVVDAYKSGEYRIAFRISSSNYGEGYTILHIKDLK